MKHRLFQLPLVASAFAALAGLAGPAAGDGGSDGGPRLHRIVVEDFAFSPDTLTVKAGDSVEWVNRDIAPHTATAEGGGWDSGSLSKRQRFRLVLAEDGTVAYRCTFHPEMRGSIAVAP